MAKRWDQDVYIKAWDFATIAHGKQILKGCEEGMHLPYINHIGRVTMEVLAIVDETPEMDANLAIQCAILHDTIEDTDTTYQEIEDAFGKEVAMGVSALTKDKDLDTKQLQMQGFIERILQQPKEIWMVKLADRITNLSPPPHYWKRDKIQAYREEAIFILEQLGSANRLLAKRLEQRIEDYLIYL